MTPSEESLEMGKRYVRFSDRSNAVPDLVREPSRLLIDVLERRVVREDLRQ